MKLSEHIHISIRSVRLLFSLSKAFLLCTVLSSILKAVLPYPAIYYSARLVDALCAHRQFSVLLQYVLLTAGITFLLNLFHAYLSSRQSVSLEEMHRNENWLFSEKAMQLSYESIEDYKTAQLKEQIQMESRTGYDVFYLRYCVETFIFNAVRIIMSLTLTLSFFSMEAIPLMTKLLLTAGIILAVITGILTTQKSEKLQNDYFRSCVYNNMLFEKYEDYLSHYNVGKDIRMYGMADGLTSFTSGVLRELADRELKANMKRAFISLADVAMKYLLMLGTYALLIYAALGGSITVGFIARYVSCIMLMLTAVSGIVSCIQLAIVNNHYLKNYFSYLDIPNHMYQGSLTVEKRDDNEYYVEFRDVSFHYPNAEAYALHHVNLKFRVGEKLAVVGMNGSGKTTFIKLLCRLYDPSEGEILLNGVNIKKYNYEEYMSLFSVVFQDFSLLSLPLWQNVAAGTSCDRKRVKICLEKAGFGERLASLPNGMDTCLYKDFDRDGVEISGGEAQKIALARALYKDAPFIVLDEPTAALDPVSEYEIYSRFNEIAGEKTAVYISHRLASCRFCDKIMVFHEGAVIQQGTHKELLSDRLGKYYELWNAQAQYYVSKHQSPDKPEQAPALL